MTVKDEVEVDVESIDRDNLIKITANAIVKVQHKAINGRFKDDEKEKIRIQYWKTLNSLIKTLSGLINDKEIDMLHDELESLRLVTSDNSDESDEDIEDKIDYINEIDERLRELEKNKD